MSYYYLVEFNDGNSFINKLEEKLIPPYKVIPNCVCVWDNRGFKPNVVPYLVWEYNIVHEHDNARIQELSEEDTFAYLL